MSRKLMRNLRARRRMQSKASRQILARVKNHKLRNLRWDRRGPAWTQRQRLHNTPQMQTKSQRLTQKRSKSKRLFQSRSKSSRSHSQIQALVATVASVEGATTNASTATDMVTGRAIALTKVKQRTHLEATVATKTILDNGLTVTLATTIAIDKSSPKQQIRQQQELWVTIINEV